MMATLTATPIRLYLMQVATLPQIDVPIVCYLVQTSDGKNILIDSGLSILDVFAPFATTAGSLNAPALGN